MEGRKDGQTDRRKLQTRVKVTQKVRQNFEQKSVTNCTVQICSMYCLHRNLVYAFHFHYLIHASLKLNLKYYTCIQK